MPRWATICKESVEEYARRIDADYELLEGFPMGGLVSQHKNQNLGWSFKKYSC